jgi:transcriptional regulator GlxA family with amidase domain
MRQNSAKSRQSLAVNPRPLPLKICVIAFDGISAFHLSVPSVVFGENHQTPSPFDLQFCTIDGPHIRSTVGFDIQIKANWGALAQADVIIVPSWPDDLPQAPSKLIEALHAAHQRNATLMGLCLGAFVLAQAKLLDHLEATTHWSAAQKLSTQFPQVRVNASALYVDEGNIITSAGTAAAIDCCLHFVRKTLGAELTNLISRRLVMAPHRQGGQAQFIEAPIAARPRDHAFANLLDDMRKTLDHKHTVLTMAQRMNTTERSVSRLFSKQTGTSPAQWLLNERLNHAQRLLETTSCSMENIALAAGFASASAMRPHFRTRFGLSPTEWRKNFSY